MKKIFALIVSLIITFGWFFVYNIGSVQAANQPGFTEITAGSIGIAITGFEGECGDICSDAPQNLAKYMTGSTEETVNTNETNTKWGVKNGLLPTTTYYMAMLFDQPSGEEYVADILNNMGVPGVSRAYAQGTGYTAMKPFLEFWKVFRNLAYSLYIIMFVVVGIMIMLRTKVNAQTIITIQTALPNLLITLLLITFSYAIVGFMIDLMYFLIYFIVYLLSSIDLIQTPTQTINRLMSNSAWSILFSGRNSIISAVALAMREVVTGISSLALFGRVTTGVATLGASEIFTHALPYLLVAIWLAVTMLKLMFMLLKSYVMLIVQTVTAPVQILMNAMPGSKAFSEWLKKTASYLLPFPVAGAMFIMAAVFVGDPTKATLLKNFDWRDSNPFGINQNHEFYSDWDSNTIWLPPFTLNGTSDWSSRDVMVLLGFFIFTMTPAAVKMAQDWLQVKESPYTSESMAGLGGAFAIGKTAYGWKTSLEHQREATQQLTTQKQMAASLKDIQAKS